MRNDQNNIIQAGNVAHGDSCIKNGKYIIHSYADTLYSCLMPYEKQFEYRMPNHSIIYVRSGELTVEQKGVEVTIDAGNYVFVKRNCTARITKKSKGTEPYRGINLTLRRPVLKEFYGKQKTLQLKMDFKPLSEVATILPKTVELQSLFDSFIAYVDNNREPSDELLNMRVNEAVMALLTITPEFYPTLFDFNESWKIDILEFMEDNFKEDMTIEEFASYTGRSLATFKRDFAKISNLTPQQWLIEHRLECAHRMLATGKAEISNVYYLVGFKNRSHFSTIFKKRFGVSPGQCCKTV